LPSGQTPVTLTGHHYHGLGMRFNGQDLGANSFAKTSENRAMEYFLFDIPSDWTTNCIQFIIH